MKLHFKICSIGFFVLLLACFKGVFTTPVNGGLGCAACSIIVGLTEQLAKVNNVSVVDLVSRQLCQLFPGQFNLLCSFLVNSWGASVVEKLANNESPDVICYSLGICHLDPGQQYCHLFPIPLGGIPEAISKSRSNSKIIPPFPYHVIETLPDVCHLPGVQPICDAITGTFGRHNPAVDLDRDKFSVIDGFRGAFWRGKDCDDVNEFVYPGRKPLFEDYVFDSNCNGIYGVNPLTGVTYEKELCDDTDQRGIIYIGDSVGARFHLPVEWFTPSQITMGIFQNISLLMSNQFDWPHLSFATGYADVDWPVLSGKADSIYQKLVNRNRCNHRDYQNIGFNGAASGTMLSFLPSISRHHQRDKPALVFYALLGNDVCKRYQETPENNTTPEEYRQHVTKSMDYLNSVLPNGSHVILIGLVDGSFIYPNMGHRTHPIGQLNNDVTYADLYDYWNCMRIGPCFGWMNRNETFRNATSQRAKELTEILKEISTSCEYDSINLHYLPNPLAQVFELWKESGNEIWTALEPIDSMHPVQEVQSLFTKVLWDQMTTKFPHVLGDLNPNNELILQLFGDQGGH